MFFKSLVLLFFVSNTFAWHRAFDQKLYQSVLDEELCNEQLEILTNNSLSLKFLDSSGKLPPGILSGNVNDLGDYYQCLSIDDLVTNYTDEFHIQGKYCTVLISRESLENSISIPDGWPPVPPSPPSPPVPDVDGEEESLMLQHWAQTLAGVGSINELQVEVENGNPNARIFPAAITQRAGGMLAVCIPRACPTRQAVDFFLSRVPFLNATYTEFYCRLPEDRPFAPADYVAISIFSLIAFLAIISTSYDLLNKFVFNKPTGPLLKCFSVYTNTKRVLTFNSVPDALECVDGIRAISMLWVVVGHTYSLTLLGFVHNISESLAWLRLFTSTWITSAPLTVDTFFLLSGTLAVYGIVGKITRRNFLLTLPMFYLNRLLRMFPLLATVVLLQASVFNYVSDGPFWQNVAQATMNCRDYWWAALLHVQNYVNPVDICLAHTWYLSVDTQLYFVCPIILVWLFGGKFFAWSALCLILLLSLVSTSVYSFTYNFTAALVQPNRIGEFQSYVEIYYINTLTRAPPFFIGMAYGYLLHLYRGRMIRIRKLAVLVLWILAAVLMAFCVFSIYPVMQLDHTAQTFDNLLNAYMRSVWAVAVGWVIFACVHGYGGPVNWFLSLRMWKLPARLSFAMYLIHLPIMMIANSSWVKTHFFTNGNNLYRFASDLFITMMAAFILCVFIDAPFSTLQKVLLGNGKKKKPTNKLSNDKEGTTEEKEEKSKL